VLHVDDDPGARRAVERVLGGAGFSVVGVGDGPDGLVVASRGRFALVVLDVDLPGMSGFEVCERLRAGSATRDVPVLHLSAARIDVCDRVRGLEAGADAYLVQPVAPEELVAVARALVSRGPLSRGRRAGAVARNAAAAMRDEAVRTAIHLLRVPLSAIAINASSLTLSRTDPVSRARATAITDAHLAIERTLAALAELAYLESRRALLPLEARVPGDLVADVARRLGAAAEECGVTVAAEAPALPPLRCDSPRLERAIETFARHAVHASARGGGVRIEASAVGAMTRFSIHGPLLAAGDDPLRNEDSLWAARHPGSDPRAVEVALARAVVAAHRGRIRLDPDVPAVHLEVPSATGSQRGSP